MGNSQYWSYFSDHQPEKDPSANVIYCQCQQTGKFNQPMIATYRCQISNDVFIQYRELQPYFYSFREIDGIKVSKYIACEFCIKDSVRDRFTHHPLGWKENPKHPIPYENVNIRKFVT